MSMVIGGNGRVYLCTFYGGSRLYSFLCLEARGFYAEFFPLEGVGGPVYVGIEGFEPWVAEDDLISA